MRFDWQPMDTAPRDGSTFVHLGICCYGALPGDPVRPITIGPDVNPILRAWFGDRPADGSGGYLRHAQANCSLRDRGGYWMTVEAYRAALDGLEQWWSAPRDRAVIFVRPVESTWQDPRARDVYEALAGWWVNGALPLVRPDAADGWRATKTFGAVVMHPGYLDGENVLARPFLWCELADFLPAAVMEYDAEVRQRMYAGRPA